MVSAKSQNPSPLSSRSWDCVFRGCGVRWRLLKTESPAPAGDNLDGRARRARALLLLVAVVLVAGPLVVYSLLRLGGGAK
jgi:hypothetical protein